MPMKNSMTQSEQYDKKLESELYLAMMDLNEVMGDVHEAEERHDEIALETHILLLLDIAPKVTEAYYNLVEKGSVNV